MPVESSVRKEHEASADYLEKCAGECSMLCTAMRIEGAPWSDELELQKLILQSHVDLPADSTELMQDGNCGVFCMLFATCHLFRTMKFSAEQSTTQHEMLK